MVSRLMLVPRLLFVGVMVSRLVGGLMVWRMVLVMQRSSGLVRWLQMMRRRSQLR